MMMCIDYVCVCVCKSWQGGFFLNEIHPGNILNTHELYTIFVCMAGFFMRQD